jgi:spore coat protein H
VDDRPAFTLNFDRKAPGQKFHGLKKIHLNNSVQDSSYLNEKISREIFESAGVPVPRAGHAVLRFNGRPMGMYVLVEGVNKQFLKRYFSDPSGNVYDGHSQNEVTQTMRVNSGDDPPDQTALRALSVAVREPNLERRLALLEKTLDVDRFLSFIALEVLLCHWDGYVMNRNNFRIFHDRAANRMVFIPHGMDQVLGRSDTPLIPQSQGLVARSVLEVPQLRQRYRDRVRQLLTNEFQLAQLTNRVVEVSQKIEVALRPGNSSALPEYPQRAASFNRRLQRRIRAVENQLPTPKSTQSSQEFDADGFARIIEWRQQTDSGEAILVQERGPDGKTALHISAQSPCAASFRSRVVLSPGQYQFVGRVKTKEVAMSQGNPRSGAGLRLSHRAYGRRLSGDVDGELITYDFSVDEDQPEVELICELRAEKGEVWFNLGSLCLVRK